MKKIVYILDPRVGNIEGQKYTISLHFDVLNKHIEKDEVSFYFCGHEKFSNYLMEKNINLKYIPLNRETESMNDKDFGNYLKSKIDFIPDLIIGYETNVSFLREVFVNSKVVSESFGAFSRFPWASMACFDECGVYDKAKMTIEVDKYQKSELSQEDKKSLFKARNFYWDILSKNFPKVIFNKLNNLNNNKKILIPLQADNHISFNNCTDYKNHKDMLEDILRKTSPDIDIIVTQHPDVQERPLTETDLINFKNKYHNFFYFKEFENIPFVSQWIMFYVDGVATVSSGLAFQAAFLGVPVFSLGNSHINAVCSADYEHAGDFLSGENISLRDNVIWKYLKDNIFYDEYIYNTTLKTKIINQLISDKNIESSNDELLEKLTKFSREKELKKILKDRNIETINNEFFTKIIEAEAVSFDLFDTLVERPFLEPHDLFLLAEFKARKELSHQHLKYFILRRKAEEEARKARNWKETTLEQIYFQFKKLSGLNNEEIKKLKEIEIEMEEKVLFQKYSIMKYFELCKKLGKKLSIITDIYHSKEVIERFLNAVNIKGYNNLYVSGELDLRKHDGTIYPLYLKDLEAKYGITNKGKNILHVGDNVTADVEQAHKFGIRAHHIYKSSDCLKKSELKTIFDKNLKKKWVTDSIVMGLIANRFNKKLEENHKNSLFGNDLHAFGYIAGGVMMLGFVQYIIEQIKGKNLEKVCFVARDAAILKEIYDMLKQTGMYDDLPPSDYLVLSRRATAVAACSTYEDFKRLSWLSFGERRLEDLLLDRFGIDIKDVPKDIIEKHHFNPKDKINGNFDLGRLSELLYDIKDLLLAQGEKERKGLLTYLDTKGIHQDSKICLVDIGYSGTIQSNLNKILKANIGGYYFLTHEAPRNLMEECVFDGWLESYDEQRSANYHPLNDYIFLFETLLSSEELSITNYELNEFNELLAKYQHCEDEISRVRFIRETHRGILNFTRDYVKFFKEYVRIPKFSKSLSMQAIMSLAKNPNKEDANLFLQLNVENKFGGGDAALIYGNKNMFANLSNENRDIIIKNSQWKEGARVIADFEPVKQSQPLANKNSKNMQVKNNKDNDFRDLPPWVRKYMKFKKNPYIFFKDSKNKYVSKLSYFYKNRK